MKALLVRVAADSSEGGGGWNAPVDSKTNEFVYGAIGEDTKRFPLRCGHVMRKPFSLLKDPLKQFKVDLPDGLEKQLMHLDPDFEHLTYGDGGERGKQIHSKLQHEDLVVFYAGLRDIHPNPYLVYGIIGLYIVDKIVCVTSVSSSQYHENAHTRRKLDPKTKDIVVRAMPNVSGRLRKCIPIGEYRNRAYRVRLDLLSAWGGLQVKDGYMQRSVRLPEFLDAKRFYKWFLRQDPHFLKENN